MKDSACKKGVCAVVTMCEQEYVGVWFGDGARTSLERLPSNQRQLCRMPG